MLRLAICFHLGYIERFDQFSRYIDNVISCHYQTDLYITYREDCDPSTMCLRKYPTAVIIKATKGADTGPFLLQIKAMIESGHHYDYVFKIHTKSDGPAGGYYETWVDDLLNPTAGTPEQVLYVIKKFQKHQKIGLIGSDKFLMDFDYDNDLCRQICRRLHIHRRGLFIGGTIFWIRMEVLYYLIQQLGGIERLSEEYQLFEEGKAEQPSYAHVWERIYGLIVRKSGYRLCGL
jgi:lipopolysaccharide biosynthesis protein